MKGYARRVQAVLYVALALNALIAAGKLLVGFSSNSLAIVADGAHSGVDAAANVVSILVLRVAMRPPDEDHPFGHAKFETLAAFLLSSMLLLTSFEVGRAAVVRILHPEDTSVTPLAIAIMVATLVVNVGVASLETRVGRRESSPVLLADAAQSRADAYVTIAVLIGLFLHARGVPQVDPLLALAVAGFIAYAAYGVFRDALPTLTDRIVHEPGEVARIVRSVPGVVNVHDIRSRGGPRESFVQMHLVVDSDSVLRAHDIADEVERRVARELGVKEVFVHVEPEDDRSGPPGTGG